MVVCPNQEFLSFQVWAELENGPNDGKAFLLRRGVIPLRSVQRATPDPDRVFGFVSVFLQQAASNLLGRRIGIQNVPSIGSR